ncbi:MAG: hypothetical protein GX443_15835 [Deltaproteobacteria bacterium]|nr:hypothetical protein [Deltaproteobacteria bacterium]
MRRLLGNLERALLTRRLVTLVKRPLEELIPVGVPIPVHFRDRQTPSFFFTWDRLRGLLRQSAPAEVLSLIQKGEDFRRLVFSFRSRPPVTFSNGVDWTLNALEDPDWNADLHRLEWMVTLVLAAHVSGEARYAREAARWLCDWSFQNPPGTAPWSDPFEVAQRANTLCWLLFLGREHRDFTDEAVEACIRVLVLSAFWIHGTLEYGTPNNHLFIETIRLAQIGLLFPEFPRAGEWFRKGMSLLEREVLRQVTTDGVHRERSSFYQRMTVEALLELFFLCRANSLRFPEVLSWRLEAMLLFVMGIFRPDDEFPILGDGFRSDILLRYDLPSLGGGIFPPSSLEKRQSSLYTRLLTNGGNNAVLGSQVPMPPVQVWKEGGVAVFRSGDAHAGNMLLMDFGPLGMEEAPGHGHADCLSLELTVEGRPVVVDPGSYSWRRAPALRRAFRGTLAHNTLVVDGKDQTPLHGFFGAGSFARPRLRRLEGGTGIRCLDASHDGYRRLASPVVHRRVVIETGSDGWIIVDMAEGSGSHWFQLAWHFHPRLALQLNKESATLLEGESVALRLLSSAKWPVEVARYRGCRDPFLGWVSWESGQLEAADVLILSGNCTAPCWLVSAFVPSGSGRDRPVLECDSDEKGLVLSFRTDFGLTSAFIAWSGSRGGSFGTWETDGTLAVVREGADPEILSWDGSVRCFQPR